MHQPHFDSLYHSSVASSSSILLSFSAFFRGSYASILEIDELQQLNLEGKVFILYGKDGFFSNFQMY